MNNLPKYLFISLLLLLVLCLASCQSQSTLPEADASDADKRPVYTKITGKEAKEIMESEAKYILLDARTEEEFAEGHIEGALLMPEYEVADRAKAELPDKDALILVYCRSGRRSKIAAEALVALGYTNVKDFGGILDWEYEVVT